MNLWKLGNAIYAIYSAVSIFISGVNLPTNNDETTLGKFTFPTSPVENISKIVNALTSEDERNKKLKRDNENKCPLPCPNTINPR